MKNRIILTGDRITVRRHRLSDAKSLTENINDEEVVRWTTNIPHPYREQHAKEFIRKTHSIINRKRGYPLAIALNQTDDVIGGIGLSNIKNSKNIKSAEMGYWLGREYWNQGIMTEAAELMLDFAFNRLDLHRIKAKAFEKNPASQKVLEKLGFAHEGTEREAQFKEGEWQNLLLYGMLKKDAQTQKIL